MIEIEEWPKSSWTIFGCTPFVRSNVAQVFRRSWNLVQSEKLAAYSRGFQDRVCRLWTLIGVPTLVQKIHSLVLA